MKTVLYNKADIKTGDANLPTERQMETGGFEKTDHPFLRRVEATILKHDMLHGADAVLIGVSGGPDSVVLMSVLMRLAAKYNLRLGIAHVNHCLRGSASDQDESFVESLARKCGLPCFSRKIDILSERVENGLCVEEAGREARYRFYYQIAGQQQYNKIALGHHRDDNAELILLNLLRGSGCAGISGIPPKRDMVVRPLIEVSRNEIMAYLAQHDLKYRIDPSNADSKYLRNRIRHQLIPELAGYNPRIADSLIRIGNILRSEDEWIEDRILPLFREVVIRQDSESLVLSIPILQRLHIAPLRRIVRKAVVAVKKDMRRISYAHIQAIVHLIRNAGGEAMIDLPDRIRIMRSRDRLIVTKEKKSLRSPTLSGRNLQIPYEYPVNAPGTTPGLLRIREINVLLKFSKVAIDRLPEEFKTENRTAWIDWDRLRFPLLVRNLRPGDRFRPFGMEGSQKINDFFCNNKVPASDRHRFPLLVSGDRVAWIAGFRIDDRVSIHSASRFALKVEFFPAPD